MLLTIGGGAAGVGISALVVARVVKFDSNQLPFLLPPLLGAILGFELSHDVYATREADSLEVRVAPVVTVGPGGGVMGGLAGRF